VNGSPAVLSSTSPVECTLMNAVEILEYGRPFHYGQRSVPDVKADEALIAVNASGLCRTDIRLLEGGTNLGQLPRIPGHEIAGEIVKLGAQVSQWQTGQRVAVATDVTCRTCVYCRAGQSQRCQDKKRIGFELDGGHADFVVAPADNLISLPDGLSYEEACVVPDAVATMYHSLIGRGKVGIHQKVIILGLGGLGIHGVQIARLAGAEVLVTSRSRARLDAARRFGALTVNPMEEDLAAAVDDFSGGLGADVVADCVGSHETIGQGLAFLRPGGKLLVIGYHDADIVVPSVPLFSTEKEVIGCRGSSRQELIDAFDLVGRGRIDVVVGATYPLSAIGEAVARMNSGSVIGRLVLTR